MAVKAIKWNSTTAGIMLVFATCIWGSGFVVTKLLVSSGITPAFLNLFRGTLYAALVFVFYRKRVIRMTKNGFLVGLVTGVVSFSSMMLQAQGAKYTVPSHASFITTGYVVLVPFIAWGIYHKRPELRHFITIVFCMGGMAILTGVWKESTVNTGDIYMLVGAVLCAVVITILSHGCKGTDPCIITFVNGCVQIMGGLIFFLLGGGWESVATVDWSQVILPLLYMGVMVSFVAQTIQVTAQQHLSAVSAGLIMMPEGVLGSVVSVLAGFEMFSYNLLIGGTIIFISLLCSQFDLKTFLQNKKTEGKGA